MGLALISGVVLPRNSGAAATLALVALAPLCSAKSLGDGLRQGLDQGKGAREESVRCEARQEGEERKAFTLPP